MARVTAGGSDCRTEGGRGCAGIQVCVCGGEGGGVHDLCGSGGGGGGRGGSRELHNRHGDTKYREGLGAPDIPVSCLVHCTQTACPYGRSHSWRQ